MGFVAMCVIFGFIDMATASCNRLKYLCNDIENSENSHSLHEHLVAKSYGQQAPNAVSAFYAQNPSV
eukprot:CAMPEP_0185586216 /NCGR_PEP_ID=MMETSP0434-20130131/43139_1 /TAXON_ID=626734 ORGANISM="Favella taraikaensis, Strain Fe Narragansett Bay" /NCGR_SAMPLE_ID=MMETSP0434 /ASSEMBLY_ACC=CAM_ASM_000379 /LENGTH=66 /DNA_ID=CAMNT_0028207171 /DNA_START=388 /DNA_END=588 /DNA_ORIENTATION=+